MDIGLQCLSSLTTYSKYAKFIPILNRRETWDEIVDRYKTMMIDKYPTLSDDIEESSQFIRNKKILPSMRMLQFAGLAIDVNNSRGYNCSYLPVDSIYSFSETMFLLLGGTGVGYSVQKFHVDQLPAITAPGKNRNYLIEDSIMGWADTIKVLMRAYLEGKFMPLFSFKAIRPKGAKLITAGGKAPGPEPLKLCIAHIQAILDRKQIGEKLSTLECHDIMCHIANAVLAGGIRRSACLCLFSHNDESLLTCKYGNWWELNEQRGRANNSAVLERGVTTKEEFDSLWRRIELSGTGEPGIYWSNDKNLGSNPCCEISLKPFSFCNLCEVNVSDIESQEDLNNRVGIASFFGTLQAGFTDFHYLRPIWKKTTEEDALLGIGLTGIGSGKILKYDFTEAANIAKQINSAIAKEIGVNEASRLTCIKPAGTTSSLLGVSSGIHAWHSNYYIRTMRFGKDEEIATYMSIYHPELCEDDILRPKDTLCVRIPIKAPEGSILRTESAIDTLERVKKFSQEWILPGHIRGNNTHNVSVTISIDKERLYNVKGRKPFEDYTNAIDEWQAVGEWMWKNKEHYTGIATLPYQGANYPQMPFEEITEKEYNERIKYLKSIDLTKVTELDDNVKFSQMASCSGGMCTVD